MNSLHAENAKRYQVNGLCELFGKTKQAYYKTNEDAVAAHAATEGFALDYIAQVRGLDPGIGGEETVADVST